MHSCALIPIPFPIQMRFIRFWYYVIDSCVWVHSFVHLFRSLVRSTSIEITFRAPHTHIHFVLHVSISYCMPRHNCVHCTAIHTACVSQSLCCVCVTNVFLCVFVRNINDIHTAERESLRQQMCEPNNNNSRKKRMDSVSLSDGQAIVNVQFRLSRRFV